MIIDLRKFLAAEKTYWTQLENMLNRLEGDSELRLSVQELKHFHYLYERCSADLVQLATFQTAPEARAYVEALVGRAYGEIHETRSKPHRFRPLFWFFNTFPQTFRRHAGAFWLACAVTCAGIIFGCAAIAFDPDAKAVIMPFPGLLQNPAERVQKEEHEANPRLEGQKAQFSSMLMTHNIRVSLLLLALGMTFGLGTLVLLFYNGIILGAVALDYIVAGQTAFLCGWLLPHGVIEIPAILLAGQGGLVLAQALLGRSSPLPLAARLRAITPELATLIGGVAVLLVWAGIVEAFFSQYHEPAIPYALKIALGLLELAVLVFFLAKFGARGEEKV
jgi:uncharacterized membrane protein SpoIIM required for sporulation